jgi:hypothetical protein
MKNIIKTASSRRRRIKLRTCNRTLSRFSAFSRFFEFLELDGSLDTSKLGVVSSPVAGEVRKGRVSNISIKKYRQV